jgi:hypothetical protein
MQLHSLQLSVGAPYLLHAIIAFSARHLNFLRPDEKDYDIVASLHYGQSLVAYTSQLRDSLDAKNSEAMVGCCHLHTILAFENIRSGIYVGQGDGLTWVRAMRGAPVLWNTTNLQSLVSDSIWNPVCVDAHSRSPDRCNHALMEETDSWATTTCKALHQLCEVPSNSIQQRNPYEQPLSRLCDLMRCSMGHEDIGSFVAFICSLPLTFVQLLERNEPRALLIVCYWCALISQIDQWWIGGPSKAECFRLCTYLESISDQKIRDLLHFPREKCGHWINGRVQMD